MDSFQASKKVVCKKKYRSDYKFVGDRCFDEINKKR